jgi:predicted small secreted protein
MKTISARWNCEGEKSDTYRLLNMVHAMAGQSAQIAGSYWSLQETATFDDYVKTVWGNGIVKVQAETHKDYEGNPILHVYTMCKDSE